MQISFAYNASLKVLRIRRQKVFVFFLLMLSFFSSGMAQSVSESPPKHDSRGSLGVGLGAGSTGGMAVLSKNLGLHFAASGGYLFFPDYKLTYETDIDGDKVKLDGAVSIQSIPVFLEYYPSKNSGFHLKTGMMISRLLLNATITPSDSQTYGNIKYSPVEIGDIRINFKTPGIIPYIGMGFGRSVPKRRIGLSLDLGAWYMGSPRAELTATKAFTPSASAENKAVIEKAFSDFKWLPFVHFSINVKLF